MNENLEYTAFEYPERLRQQISKIAEAIWVLHESKSIDLTDDTMQHFLSQWIRRISESKSSHLKSAHYCSIQAQGKNSNECTNEHIIPAKFLTNWIVQNLQTVNTSPNETFKSKEELIECLIKLSIRAKITKDENKKLKDNGYNSIMPSNWIENSGWKNANVFARYNECGITLIKNPSFQNYWQINNDYSKQKINKSGDMQNLMKYLNNKNIGGRWHQDSEVSISLPTKFKDMKFYIEYRPRLPEKFHIFICIKNAQESWIESNKEEIEALFNGIKLQDGKKNPNVWRLRLPYKISNEPENHIKIGEITENFLNTFLEFASNANAKKTSQIHRDEFRSRL